MARPVMTGRSFFGAVTCALIAFAVSLACGGADGRSRGDRAPASRPRSPSAGSAGDEADGSDRSEVATPGDRDRSRVCLDPGHPSEPGERLYEAIINRKVVFYLKGLFEEAGYEVRVTTSDLAASDLFRGDFDNEGELEQSRLQVLPVPERAQICNDWKADYLISVHHNKASDTSRNVVSVFYGQDPRFRPWHARAPRWAALTAKRLYAAMQGASWKSGGDQDTLGFSLGLFESATMIGILTEASFYSHPPERARLNDNAYLSREARAIFAGFTDFVGKK